MSQSTRDQKVSYANSRITLNITPTPPRKPAYSLHEIKQSDGKYGEVLLLVRNSGSAVVASSCAQKHVTTTGLQPRLQTSNPCTLPPCLQHQLLTLALRAVEGRLPEVRQLQGPSTAAQNE
jgi:hypothetical protein